MMPGAFLTVGLIAPLLLVLGGVAELDTHTHRHLDLDARKCAVRSSDQVRYLVDGRETDSLALSRIDTADVRSVSVLCVNPVDLSLIAPGSGVPGVPAIAIWTSGPLSQLESLLTRVNEAQRAHFTKTGDYALTLEQLRIAGVSDDLRLTLDAAPGRWRAEATVMRPVSPRCVVFDGQHGEPTAGTPGVVRCHDQ